jgi:hypothetical protein
MGDDGVRRQRLGATMKILFTAILMIAIPFSAAAVQYCQEVDPANLAHIQRALDIVNTRDGTTLTVAEFMSETLKKRVMGEIVRELNEEAQAKIEAQNLTREQLIEEAGAIFEAERSTIEETW